MPTRCDNMNGEKQNALKYAIENCKYYKNYDEKYWDKIPHINKSIVNKHYNDFISTNQNEKNMVRTTTSGTSGEMLTVIWGKSEYTKSIMTLWQQRIKYGIYPSDKFCTAHACHDNYFVGYNSLLQINEQKNCLSFNKIFLDDKYLKFYCEEINKFQPKWLLLQPSVALKLGQYYKYNNIKTQECIKFIELSGEILTSNIREQLNDIFNAKIINHYGAQEFNCIAYECKCGELHINSDNVYIDIGENNQFYITSLLNHTMPLIKYSLGDMAEYIKEGEICNCGNKSPILKLKKGRETDVININGIIYDCSLFFYIVDKINILYNNIFLQFYVEQKKDMFNIYLLPKNKESVLDKNNVKNDINKILSSMGIYINNFNVILSHKFPLNSSGKLNYFKVFS